MFKKLTPLALLGALLPGLISCSSESPVPAEDSLVRTSAGAVLGIEGEHDTFVWKGIPYAAPPIGDLRWRAPRAAKAWEGTLDAFEYGAACVQPDNPTAGPNAPEFEHVIGVEDCLTLNVFSPRSALNSDKALPVMYWIHGGANMMGSSQVYDASRLASSQNVVVVSVNYRLGLLGWIRHASLRAPGESAADHSGNYGTLDIIAGLEWVRDNIANFGGDPGRVTVFGESAGGRNTWSMVQTPLARDLFHGAIVQSGSLKIMDAAKSERIDEAAVDYPSHENNGSQLIAKIVPNRKDLATDELAAVLRAKTPDEIYAQVKAHPQGMYEQPRLFLDGHVFLEPALELFEDPRKYNAVPIITGTNRNEDKLFLMFDERWVNFKFGFLPTVKDTERYETVAALYADTWRLYSVDKPARVITEHGGEPVYTYRFDFDDLADTILDLPTLLGAAHAMEIPFVFGTHNEMPWKWLFSNETQRTALSDTMMNYWGEFARTGKPGKGSEGNEIPWTPWRGSGSHIMLFDAQNDGGVRMVENRLKIKDITSRLMSEGPLTEDERCEAYPALLLNGYMVTDGYVESEHTQVCSL